MELEYTCVGISEEKWNQLMKGRKPMSYNWLKSRIKKNLPDLYKSLDLNLYNPYESHTYRTKTHYILTHSSIEYFIAK